MKKLYILMLALLCLTVATCKKDVEPYVFNADIKVTDIKTNMAVIEAINEEEGFDRLEAVVLCSADEKVKEPKQYKMTYEDEAFKANVDGLLQDTKYYYKIIFTGKYNSVETEVSSFETEKIVLPIVTTAEATEVTTTTAVCGGNVTSDGGGTITARGVCWSTNHNPTIEDNKTTNGSGTGVFTSNLSNLSSQTTYYVRAYATNEAGTAYGEEKSFTTLEIVLPTVTTTEVTNITVSSATCGGNVTTDGNATVTSRGVCWSTNHNPTIEDNKTTNGSGIGSFTSSLSNLASQTTYYVRAYATNEKGTAYGEEKSFTTLEILKPTVKTNNVTSITENTATCGGNVTSDGGGTITARGVCWSISKMPTIDNNKTNDGSGTGVFTSNLSNLSSKTTYYVRAYATNEAGTAYGEEKIFTTQKKAVSLPDVLKTTVSNVTSTTAVFGSGVFSDGGGIVSARGFCWSCTTETPTITDSSFTTNGSGLGSFSADVTGLKASTQYYVRAYATNEAGTAYGEIVAFYTSMEEQPEEPIILPTVTTAEVTNITTNSATCGGNVTSDGNATVTSRGVCWSTSPNPTIDDNKTTDGSGTGSYTSNLSNLTPQTTYYVRAYATNEEGTAYGEEKSFVTLQNIELPTVTTTDITNVGETTATSGGNVTSDGNGTVTARGVCWSTSPNPTIDDNKTTDGSGIGGYTSNLSDLASQTTYYVRAYATNEAGTAYGEEKSFTTLQNIELPTVTTTDITNLSETTATSGGNVTSDGNGTVTARGVCWSTSPNPTIADNKTTDGSGIGSFTSSLSDLASQTTYYVRAYATNEAGTSYGEVKSFMTLEEGQPEGPIILPTVTTTEVTNITVSSATCGGNVTSDGNATVTARGVCWSTSPNPTIDDNKTTDGSDIGSFTSSLSNLASQTTYYVRAYATNELGTSYGEVKSFMTLEEGQPEEPETPSANQSFTVNGVTFTMIAVEGGTFKMGAQSSDSGGDNYDSDAESWESPVHDVTLSSYYIGETEVTQELWEAVMGSYSNPSRFNGYPQKPVEQVTWNDCQEFITKLNNLTGKNFRLPTEAEWEYAARGGNKSNGYKYSGSNTIGNVAWYEDNCSSTTHDVKTKQANELGIYDMSGNVYEWCQDLYGSYSSGSQTNPTGPSSGSTRVARGGSWNSDSSWSNDAEYCRVSYRCNSYPDDWFSNFGLRLALSQY